MPYIGKQPLTGAYQLCDTITTSATATYNLLVGGSAVIPGSANNCIVSLNGVVQAPVSAFTVSGSTITFASTLSATDVIDFILILGNVFDIGTPTNGSVNTSKLATDLTVTHALGSAGSPSITFTGDTNTGIFSPTADTIGFVEGGTEAMRINSSGQILIGGTTPTSANEKLYISSTSAISTAVQNSAISAGHAVFKTTTGVNNALLFTNSESFNYGVIGVVSGNGTSTGDLYKLGFTSSASAGGTNSLVWDSQGVVMIGTTNTNPFGNNVAGISFNVANGIGIFSRDGNEALAVNRKSNDGMLVNFGQDGTQEGTISVAGNTVSYNGFTGSHWSRFIDESKPDLLRGTVMESLDQMTDWYLVKFETSYTEKDEDGNDVVKTVTNRKPYALKANEQEGDVITYAWNTEKKDEDDNDIIEQVQATIVKQKDVKHVMSKISDTSEAKNVYGVFSAWDNDDLINNDFYVASVGSYVVRIKAGQTVSKGDLLQSNGDGTAKVQADDMIRSSTFAKVLSNTVIDTYEDGSFIVPCSLMC